MMRLPYFQIKDSETFLNQQLRSWSDVNRQPSGVVNSSEDERSLSSVYKELLLMI